MCTVVVRWSATQPLRILALRDELQGRAFDDPGAWWPQQPTVVGGRDRSAGGTWCATEVTTGDSALVLNRPQRRTAEPGAASRGVLPLTALRYGTDWTSHVELVGMASFALVLATAAALRLWVFDGADLVETDLPAGISMVTSGGAEDGKAARYRDSFEADDWLDVVRAQRPEDDPTALVVRHPIPDDAEGRVFATVFGQLIEVAPGSLALTYSREPTGSEPWASASWTATGSGLISEASTGRPSR